MNYYPFDKKPISYRIVVALGMFVYLVLASLVVTRWIYTVLSILFRLPYNDGMITAVNIIGFLIGFILWFFDTFSQKGVYVYYDKIVIRNGLSPVICRRIRLTNITAVQFVYCCRKDEDYRRIRYFSNLVAGDSGFPAAKLHTVNRGIRFVGVADTAALVTDLQRRLERLEVRLPHREE